MAITSIARNFDGDPNIVTIVCDDSLATITTAGYLTGTTIAGNIENLQNGEFQWTDTDLVLISYSGGIGFFTYDSANNTFVSNPAGSGISTTLPSSEILVGNGANVATAVAMSGDVAIDNAGATTIQAASIDLAMLSTGITPSHVVKFAGQPTTAGGGAAEAITVTGALNTDLAFVQMVDDGTNNVTIVDAVVTADTLTVTFSGDPGNDAVINYQLLRAAS